MSSLAGQLGAIANTSGSTVLDRNKRQNLHSTSLIFESKVAATQDYQTVLSHSLEALNDLMNINHNFSRFKDSLFSETAISIDRNMLPKEQVRDLNNAIDNFLRIMGSYWDHPASYNAVEWLVRRFYIHIHNAESFLLSILPYYSTRIFLKIVQIIPTLPPLFSWLTGSKKAGKLITREAVNKGGFNDIEFVNLYLQYIDGQITRNFVYSNQLVFLVTSIISSLSNNSTNEVFLEKLTGLILKISGKLLASKRLENQIAANTLIVVMSASYPLSLDLIDALLDGLCSNPLNKKSTLTTIIKLYQSIQGIPNIFPKKNYYKILNITNSNGEITEFFRNLIINDSSNKLLISLLRRSIRDNSYQKLNLSIEDIIKSVKLSNNAQTVLIAEMIESSKNPKHSDKSELIKFIEIFAKNNKKLFLLLIEQQGLSISSLEMNLQTVLVSLKPEEIKEIDNEKSSKIVKTNTNEDEKSSTTSKIDNLKPVDKKIGSFLTVSKEVNTSFKQLMSLYIESCKYDLQIKLLEKLFNSDLLQTVSFLLRISVAHQCPLLIRSIAIDQVFELLTSIKEKYYLMTVFPILLILFCDDSKLIRSKSVEFLEIFKSNSTLKFSEDEIFVKDAIFGNNQKELMVLSPKDSLKFVEILIENKSIIIIDGNQIFKIFGNLVFTSSSLKKIILAYLAVNSNIINIPFIKINLMKVVTIGTKKIKNSTPSSFIYSDFLNEYLENRNFWKDNCEFDKFDFRYFETNVLELLNFEKTQEKTSTVITSLTFLQKSLNCQFQQLVDLSIEKLTKNFNDLKLDYQFALTQNIIETSVSDENNELYDGLLVLQSLPLTTEVFTKLFSNFQLFNNGQNNNTTSNNNNDDNLPKRRRRSSTNTKQAMKKTEVAKLAEVHLKNVIILLETYEKVGVNLIPNSKLLLNLFNLMTDLETLGTDGNLPVLYAQESLANCLLISVSNSIKHSVVLQSNSIRADVLVSIIRSSNSPQLQNKLLLVIAELAILEPEFILHSIMPIFTFMGAYTIKQDDEYSTYVIEQTISKVIPALALNAKNNGSQLEEIEFLLTSFISAFNHIPRHRRVNLFTTLSNILEPENSVHIILFLIGKQYSKAFIKHKFNECKSLVDFTKSLMKNFEITTQLLSIKKYMDIWSFIPNKSIDNNLDKKFVQKLRTRPIFDPEFLELNSFDMLMTKKNLINFINRSIITDGESNIHSLPYLKLQVATLLLNTRSEPEVIERFLDVFNEIIKVVLLELSNKRIDDIEEHEEDDDDDEESEVVALNNKINRKFYRLLNDILSLLPINFLVDTIIKLIDMPFTPENCIVISNVIFLASKQFELETSDNTIAISSGNKLFKKLVVVIEEFSNDNSNIDLVEVVQNSLDTLSSLIDKFHLQIDVSYMMKMLTLITKIDNDKKVGLMSNFSMPEIVISSLNLISNIVSVVGIKAIGFLAKILPPSFEIFQKCNESLTKEVKEDDDEDEEDEERNTFELIETSVALLYSSFIKNMPQVISSNLVKILLDLLNANLIKKDITLSVLNVIFTNIDLKILFKSLIGIWDSVKFEKTSSSTIGLYLNLLTQTIEGLEKSATITSIGSFLKFMISGFEFIKNNDEAVFNKNAIARIESLIFNCELQYVMKLNDKTFRPLFNAAVSWAFDNNTLSTKDELMKITIVLKFFNKLQENLKSIITSYFNYIIDHVYNLLDKFNSKELSLKVDYIVNVQRLIFISLSSSFKYDQSEYWSVGTRFEKISTKLCDQLLITDAKVGKYLTKAISTLAVKNSKVIEHNKALHKLLINHLKVDCSTQEKFSTIKALENIYVKVGTSWLSLLPQLVPFIAELLEDDDEKIELEVRSGLIKVIENVLGESLDKYLT